MGEPQADPRPDDFKGSDRFQILRRLGAGGFGVVYEALDRGTGAVVALKILRRGDAPSLYRFKREFRALADVTHPNLVALYELIGEGALWFFTMELIEGVDFLEYVWGAPYRGQEASASSSPTRGAGSLIGQTFHDAGSTLIQPVSATQPPVTRDDPAATIALRVPPSGGADEPVSPTRLAAAAEGARAAHRLRDALAQLTAGVLALHDAGKRHCDIKPLNVRVTPEGRVVLLDFGLVSEGPAEADLHEGGIAGSVSYMSPEQAGGQPVTEATDWYAVGAVLYEALTGTVPFRGPIGEVLRAKQQADVPPPSRLAEGIPSDLDEICQGLLRRNVAERLTGRELLARLGRDAARAPSPGATAADAFIGRDRHLRSLEDALTAVVAGETTLVQVKGRSGMGKSTLLRRFFAGVEERHPGAVVVAGRCFERESVPYKGLDTLVEALAHRLRTLPEKAWPRAPAGTPSLLRLFPVLRQVPWLAVPPAGSMADPHEARRQAVAAFGELLAILASRGPLVLALDDLQWGDVDSALLMGEVVGLADRPPLLLIAAYRDEGTRQGPFLATIDSLLERSPRTLRVETVDVGTLDSDEAQALARRLVRDGSDEVADAIARESGGSALVLTELVRYWQGGGTIGPVTLEGMIHARIDRLSLDERRLLELVAVAGQPVLSTVARSAAGMQRGEPEVARLRAAHLVRLHGSGPPSLETWHDRIREVVVAELPPDLLRRHHLSLARALEATQRADPEALAVHYNAAGEAEAAAGYAVEAAARAEGALAFDRAARLYRLALEARGPGHPEAGRLRRELGDALANGGRGAEAAEAYLSAVPGAEPAEAFELRRRAAEQFLRAGHIDAGLELMPEVLRAVGLKMPRSLRGALLLLLGRRAWLRVRGLGWRERRESEVPPTDLQRIDTCWSMADGLSLVDSVRGSEFQTRHLLLALRAGEPYRVARALAVESAQSAIGGSRTLARTRHLVEEAARLAERVGHPHALGLSAAMAGVAAFLEGRWQAGVRETDRGARILRDRCPGSAHELAATYSYNLMSLLYLGELRELARRLPPLLQDADDRGDLFSSVRLRTRLLVATLLAADEPERAARQVEQAIARWSHQAFFIQHYTAAWARATLGLYQGEPLASWQELATRLDALRRSLLLRVQFIRVEFWHLRARSALAAAAAGTAAPDLLRRVEQDIARIHRERTPWGDALALLLEAGLATTRREPARALALLAQGDAACQATDLGLFAATARRRRGELLGGSEGAALCADADAWMRAQTIANPERMARLYVPGRWS
jgi:serine/threonine protein kinase